MKNHPYEVHYRMRNSAEARWLWSAAYATQKDANAEIAAVKKRHDHVGTKFVVVENHADTVAIVIDPGVIHGMPI